MNLSAHFTLDEMLRNSGEHSAPAHVILNARHTAEVLEQVRRHLGDVPIVPTSWWRPPARNADTTGAAVNSSHLYGYGVDFNIPGMTPGEVVRKLRPHVRSIGVDQLIDERDHVHLSADPRRRGEVLREVQEGVYVPFDDAPRTPNMTLPGLPAVNGAKPGTLVWWLALAVALLTAALNFFKGS